MANMKKNESGFGLIEVMLVLIFIVLIVFVGFYISNNRTKNTTSTATTKPSVAAKTTNPTTAKATPTLSDNDLIIAAVKAYAGAGGSQANDTVTINSIVGENAQGSFNDPTNPEAGGAAFIAHKANGSWSVIFEGQQAPDSTLGVKYGLPTSWYESGQ